LYSFVRDECTVAKLNLQWCVAGSWWVAAVHGQCQLVAKLNLQ
jgi:hypothetical protein